MLDVNILDVSGNSDKTLSINAKYYQYNKLFTRFEMILVAIVVFKKT